MVAGAISTMAGAIGPALRERTATDMLHSPLTTKGKPRLPEKVPFGGYVVNFKGCTDTRESLFGSVPMPPSGMTKRLWEYVKRHRLATKG